mmetsp:Transcript_89528/g.241833  ORF Transcript_89528/g.241833 Transcript_89528/m.241833 type:complete len:209 (+) Transcript_89528:340-966(+)
MFNLLPSPLQELGPLAASAASGHRGLEVLEGLHDAVAHRLLRAAHPLARVVVALVGLVVTLGVANLALQVALVGLVEVEQTHPVGPLRVRVDVHLHDPGIQGGVDVLLLGAGATVEDEEEGLLIANLGAEVGLEGGQQLRSELHIAGLVDAVHVAEGGRDGEHRRDRAQLVPDEFHVVLGGVHLVLGRARVVDAILDAAGDTDLHLQD